MEKNQPHMAHLSEAEKSKIALMHHIRSLYEQGKLTLEEARGRVRQEVGQVTPHEYAMMEQTYTPTQEPDTCMLEELKDVKQVFGEGWSNLCPDLPDGHPVQTYYRENEALKELIGKMEVMLEQQFIHNPWAEAMEQLSEIRKHYQRKQNQLYPLFEQKGFMHPSTAMWSYDDYNRDHIRDARQLLEDGQQEAFLAAIRETLPTVLDLINKEERILLPTALKMMTDEEFEAMRIGDDEIGYCLVRPLGEAPQTSSPEAAPATEGLAGDLQALLAKYGLNAGGAAETEKELDVKTGKLTLEQINLIYQHMPVDLSFVDENELVRFYTDTKHRVFPRSAGVIGRQVRNCHPPKSVHIVEEIVEKFRSGEKDEVEFWINKPEVFIYIKYVAVRDAEGRFRGVLEMMQDCTHIRKLQGSQVLLNWEAGDMQK